MQGGVSSGGGTARVVGQCRTDDVHRGDDVAHLGSGTHAPERGDGALAVNGERCAACHEGSVAAVGVGDRAGTGRPLNAANTGAAGAAFGVLVTLDSALFAVT